MCIVMLQLAGNQWAKAFPLTLGFQLPARSAGLSPGGSESALWQLSDRSAHGPLGLLGGRVCASFLIPNCTFTCFGQILKIIIMAFLGGQLQRNTGIVVALGLIYLVKC